MVKVRSGQVRSGQVRLGDDVDLFNLQVIKYDDRFYDLVVIEVKIVYVPYVCTVQVQVLWISGQAFFFFGCACCIPSCTGLAAI